jgi:hypothetical protein
MANAKMKSLSLVYNGIAPIPKGTKVKILVDNPDQPSKAYQIKDLNNNIEYTSRKAQTALGFPADFISGSVIRVTIYSEGRTLIVIITDNL